MNINLKYLFDNGIKHIMLRPSQLAEDLVNITIDDGEVYYRIDCSSELLNDSDFDIATHILYMFGKYRDRMKNQ